MLLIMCVVQYDQSCTLNHFQKLLPKNRDAICGEIPTIGNYQIFIKDILNIANDELIDKFPMVFCKEYFANIGIKQGLY